MAEIEALKKNTASLTDKSEAIKNQQNSITQLMRLKMDLSIK